LGSKTLSTDSWCFRKGLAHGFWMISSVKKKKVRKCISKQLPDEKNGEVLFWKPKSVSNLRNYLSNASNSGYVLAYHWVVRVTESMIPIHIWAALVDVDPEHRTNNVLEHQGNSRYLKSRCNYISVCLNCGAAHHKQ